jgi:hypothetical protein
MAFDAFVYIPCNIGYPAVSVRYEIQVHEMMNAPEHMLLGHIVVVGPDRRARMLV